MPGEKCDNAYITEEAFLKTAFHYVNQKLEISNEKGLTFQKCTIKI